MICVALRMDEKLKNIENTEIETVFFCQSHDAIMGGTKVIYKHAEMVATFGVKSSVYTRIVWDSTARGLIITQKSVPITH